MLKNVNYSLLAFFLFSIKLVVFGSSVSDAIALFALAGLYGFSLFLESKKETPINDEIKKDLENVKSAVNALKIGRTLR